MQFGLNLRNPDYEDELSNTTNLPFIAKEKGISFKLDQKLIKLCNFIIWILTN